jgi:hypothetical protein
MNDNSFVDLLVDFMDRENKEKKSEQLIFMDGEVRIVGYQMFKNPI